MITMEFTKKLTFFLLLSVYSMNCFPSRPLNDRPSELTWQAWLLVDSQSQLQNESDRRITPKSVFIAPKLNGQRNDTLPDCPEGYKSDSMGRCVQLVKIDETAHLNFLLQRLNEMYAPEEEEYDEDIEDESLPTAGPLQFNIPLGQEEDISTVDANTNGQFNVDGIGDDKVNVKRQPDQKTEGYPHINSDTKHLEQTDPKDTEENVKNGGESNVKSEGESNVKSEGESNIKSGGESNIKSGGESNMKDMEESVVKAGGESNVKGMGQSHVNDRGQSHVNGLGQSHVNDRGQSHVNDREQSHVNDRGQSHISDMGQSHVNDRGQSHVNDRGQSHVNDMGQSHGSDMGQSHGSDMGQSHGSDMGQSHVNDRGQSHVKNDERPIEKPPDYYDKKDEDYNDKKDEDYNDKKDEEYYNKKDEEYNKEEDDEYDDIIIETTTQTEPITTVTDATTEMTTTIPTTEETSTDLITSTIPSMNDDLKALFFLMPTDVDDKKNGQTKTEKPIEIESIIAQTSSISQAVKPNDKETILLQPGDKIEPNRNEPKDTPFFLGQRDRVQPILFPPKIHERPNDQIQTNGNPNPFLFQHKDQPVLFHQKDRDQPVLFHDKDQSVLFHQKDGTDQKVVDQPVLFHERDRIVPTDPPKPDLKLNLRFPDTSMKFPEAIEINQQKNHNTDFTHYYTGSQETHHKPHELSEEQIREFFRQFVQKPSVDRREVTHDQLFNHRNRDRHGELWNLSPQEDNNNNNKQHLRYGRYPPPYYPQGLYNPKHLAPHHEVQYYGEETPEDYTFGRKRRRGNLR